MRRLLACLLLAVGFSAPAVALGIQDAAAYPNISNTWRNVSSPQGSLNCLIEAKQPFSYLVQVRKTAGVCSNISVETYIYNSQFMADHDALIGPVPNGRIFEARAGGGQPICYVYISWRDGAGVFRDALYMRGGGVA